MPQKKKTMPAQSQKRQPGHQALMTPEPETIRPTYRGSGKLMGKVALVTGGDSGIGRAVAVHFAREGAKVAIGYLTEDADARETQRLIELEGTEALIIKGDLASQANCHRTIERVVRKWGALDVLVNNHAQQFPVEQPEDLKASTVRKTFENNVFSFFYLIESALPHLPKDGCIINSGSVTGVRGSDTLLDYASTKGAIHALTFSLAKSLADRGIRVNAVAPGPIWTPLIPASFSRARVSEFGSDTLLHRPGQPSEVAPAYVFLASQDASFITGQLIHVNGGGHISA